MVQWLRVRLPMQGTRVRALVREDPTCRGATKPGRHNYWVGLRSRAHEPQLLKPARLEPLVHNKRSHRDEKPAHRNKEWPPLAATTVHWLVHKQRWDPCVIFQPPRSAQDPCRRQTGPSSQPAHALTRVGDPDTVTHASESKQAAHREWLGNLKTFILYC